MGMFINSGNGAFQVALNSEIYVDKTGLPNCVPWWIFCREPLHYYAVLPHSLTALRSWNFSGLHDFILSFD